MSARRLPRCLLPLKYSLNVKPDLVGCTFGGHLEVDLKVEEECEQIILNSCDLTFEPEKTAVQSNGREIDVKDQIVQQKEEKLLISLTSPLQKESLAKLRLSYEGKLNDLMRGFYRTKQSNGESNFINHTKSSFLQGSTPLAAISRPPPPEWPFPVGTSPHSGPSSTFPWTSKKWPFKSSK